MKVAILGYGGQGKSSYRYWNTPEHEVTICDGDKNLQAPAGAPLQTGKDYLKNLDIFDVIVRTPIIHPRQIVEANNSAQNILDKVTSNTNEFLNVCPTKNIIGVTGTKGKGTTSTLITKMLEAAGKRVHLGGNIGTPPLDLLGDKIQPDDWVVLELANFQLIDLKKSPHISVCLMVVPEHMDWHEDYEEYIAAKQQLFINQTKDDVAVYYADNEDSESIANASEGTLIPYMEQPGAFVNEDRIMIDGQEICTVNEVALLGKHNWQNVCAALTAVWQITQNTEAFRSVITNFRGLPFRIEFRKEVAGISYYNDSFATAAGATIAATRSIEKPKIMIIGGFERGLDMSGLAAELRSTEHGIRKVILIGDSAKRTAQAFDDAGFANYLFEPSKDMSVIVKTATGQALPGDAVVLSPAFASFDMFKNFEDRGNKFNTAVDAL